MVTRHVNFGVNFAQRFLLLIRIMNRLKDINKTKQTLHEINPLTVPFTQVSVFGQGFRNLGLSKRVTGPFTNQPDYY